MSKEKKSAPWLGLFGVAIGNLVGTFLNSSIPALTIAIGILLIMGCLYKIERAIRNE